MTPPRWSIRLTALALAVAACTSAQDRAAAAIAAADRAVAAIATDAAKVFPYDIEQLGAAVKAARDTLARGDSAAALAIATAIPARADSLAARVPARRAELGAQLDTLRAALRINLASIQGKVDELAKSRRLPPGLDPAELAAVRQLLVTAPGEWEQVEAEVREGELDSAYGRATMLRLKVSAALDAVGLVASEAEWHNVKLPPS